MSETEVDMAWSPFRRTNCAYLTPFPETNQDCDTPNAVPDPVCPSSSDWKHRISRLQDEDFIWICAHGNATQYIHSYRTSTAEGLRSIGPGTLKMLIDPFLTAHCHWIFHVCKSVEFAKAFWELTVDSEATSPLTVIAGGVDVGASDTPRDLEWVKLS